MTLDKFLENESEIQKIIDSTLNPHDRAVKIASLYGVNPNQESFQGYLVLSEMLVKSQRESLIDDLTGLHNRKFFSGALEFAFNAVQSQREEVSSLLYLDIDHFKRINDEYGHGMGDTVLKGFGEVVSGSVRDSDLVARIGGEEFVIVLEGANIAEAMLIGEKVRKNVKSRFFYPKGKDLFSITTSYGIAENRKNSFLEAGSWVNKADGALYNSKKLGRNRGSVFYQDKYQEVTPLLLEEITHSEQKADDNTIPFPVKS